VPVGIAENFLRVLSASIHPISVLKYLIIISKNNLYEWAELFCSDPKY
jgi:hypothetical protein